MDRYRRLRETALVLFRKCRESECLSMGMRSYADLADELKPAGGEGKPDCRKGCSHCCVVHVTVLVPEAYSLASWAHENCGRDFYEKLKEQAARLRWVEEEDRPLMYTPCIFLGEEGECTVHPIRPLLCRGVTSLSEKMCRDAIAMSALGEPISVVMDLVQREHYDKAFKSAAEGIEKAGGDARGYELTWAVLKAYEAILSEKEDNTPA
ncbi:YkgJ family cysteine cluster protein [Limisalsivibrio acetivorans]|uniref:YkgJ family cysteine cluster protein n=1 Tax=Limisalsivibrio acetivorans TaxID=1304888 RepID=UPI0003B79F9D|nr:YkgJ family cysteine cluster protein [Limisalsivibrio acetivorans]